MSNVEKPTGMILAGIFATENIDTSGESLIIKGLDISDIEAGHCLVNYEHKNEKSNDSNGQEIVGVVLSAKKIYGKDDCSNDLEHKAWDDVKLPLLFGYVRLFDGAGHPGAIALAASIRDQTANKEKVLLRWSVEGHTVTRIENKLAESLIKRLTATFKPANRATDTTLVSDPGAPEGFKKDLVPKKEFPELDTLKFENPEYYKLGYSDTPFTIVDGTLSKAIEAGSYGAAPSSLVGGAALQKEDAGLRKPLKQRVRDLLDHKWSGNYNKDEAKKLIKYMLPEVSESYIDHFEKAIEDLELKRNQIKKSENPLFKLHNLEISLRKSIDDLKFNSLTDAHLPCVYVLFCKFNDKEFQAGRFMLYNNSLHHLEDYYGLLDNLLPAGPLTFELISKIYSLRNGPNTRIQLQLLPLGIEDDHLTDEPKDESTPAQKPDSVWEYFRSGMDTPHTLECNNGEFYLDLNRLSEGEVETIFNNVSSGIASLRYKAPADVSLAKMEDLYGSLAKAEDLDPGSALSHVRNAVASGHLHPDVERALTRHIYTDPRTGHGNKYAFNEFRKQNKPGVHVGLDLNDFKSVNDTFGHDVGDQAIKSFGEAVGNAANEAAPGAHKIFFHGGDEGAVHFPSNEHAVKFARALHQNMQKLQPIGGTHKLSASMGFGNTAEDADKALLMAKEQKYHPGQENVAPRQKKSKFPIGQVPNLGHSLVAGNEGPMQIHDPSHEAIKQSLPKPEPSKTPAQPTSAAAA